MQVVIEISEAMLKSIKKCAESGMELGSLHKAVVNGIVLPKGHGDLKDYSQLDETMVRLNCEENEGITRGQYKIIDHVLFEMPTIIEADKVADNG